MDPTRIYEGIDSLIAGLDDQERSGYFEHLRDLYPQELGAQALSGAGAEVPATQELPLTAEQRRLGKALLEVDVTDILTQLGEERRAQAEQPEGKDESSVQPAEGVDSEEQGVMHVIRETLPKAMEHLSYRERRVIEERFGLDGEKPKTLRQVCSTFKITQERVRQIQNQAQRKLYLGLQYEAVRTDKEPS